VLNAGIRITFPSLCPSMKNFSFGVGELADELNPAAEDPVKFAIFVAIVPPDPIPVMYA
jgi:hypothetical protein